MPARKCLSLSSTPNSGSKKGVTPEVTRRIKRTAAAGASLALAAAMLTGYGWRYGLTPLPMPVPGCRPEPLPELPWSQVTTNHSWYWFRELDHVLASGESWPRRPVVSWPQDAWGDSGAWAQVVEDWAQSGRLPEETHRSIGDWLQRHPEVALSFQCVLRSTENRAPSSLEAALLDRVLLLSHYPLITAACGESDGRNADTFRALTDAWRFQARLTPPEEFPALFDERGGDQLNALIARPWRRIALTGPTLPRPEVRLLLEELVTVTNALTSLENAYRRQLAFNPASRADAAPPDWSRVRSAFRVAGLRLRQECGRLTSGLLERLVGGRRPAPLQAEGVRHLRRPLGELIAALQHAAAQPDDFQRIRAARFSHALAEVRQTGPYASAPSTEPRSGGGESAPSHSAKGSNQRQLTSSGARWPRHDRWPWWRRAVDRPAVWDSVRGLPTPATLRESRHHWLVLLESCRLTLALRAFRDQHGRWPAQWGELVPDILPAVPLDPFSGAPFGYEQSGEAWAFWSVGPAARRPTPEEAPFPPQRLFRSTDVSRP